MPQDWRPGLRQEDCVSVELRSKTQWSEKYAAVMKDGSEYWLDRTTSMLEAGLGNGPGLMWWRSDMALVGAFEEVMAAGKTLDAPLPLAQPLIKKVEEWAKTQLGDAALQNSPFALACTKFDLINMMHRSRMRYKQVSDKACALGSRAHFLCELWLKNKGNLDYDMGTGEVLEYDIDTEEVEVQRSFSAFCKWFEQAGLVHETSEIMVYDIDIGVAGRYDHGLRRESDGGRHMVDLKTSKGFYPSMLLQVPGYVGMAAKCGLGLFATADIIRIDKTTAEFSVMPVFTNGDEFRRLYAQFRDVVRTARFMQWAESYTGKFNRKAKS